MFIIHVNKTLSVRKVGRGGRQMVMVKGAACASSRDQRKQDMFSQWQMVQYGWGPECAVGHGERQSLRKGPTLS